MNSPLSALYTNEATSEFLRRLNDPHFTEDQLAEFSDEAVAMIHEQQAYIDAHPALAIYRLATEGSQTRGGGVVQQASSSLEVTLNNGQKVRVAQKDDCVVYTDGSTAQIVTGAGKGNGHVALVGSRLSNGDEIINTLQDCGLFIGRDGVPMAEDFLPSIGGEDNQ
jgi:hypothetical protein